MPKELKTLNKSCFQFLLMIDVVSRKTLCVYYFQSSAQRGATGDGLKTQNSYIIEKDLVPNRASQAL